MNRIRLFNVKPVWIYGKLLRIFPQTHIATATKMYSYFRIKKNCCITVSVIRKKA